MIFERDIEKNLKNQIDALGGRCLKWVCPSLAGVPDRIVLLKGKIYFVELKRPKGELSRLQIHFGKWLMANGFNYYVLMSEYDVEYFINEITRLPD